MKKIFILLTAIISVYGALTFGESAQILADQLEAERQKLISAHKANGSDYLSKLSTAISSLNLPDIVLPQGVDDSTGGVDYTTKCQDCICLNDTLTCTCDGNQVIVSYPGICNQNQQITYKAGYLSPTSGYWATYVNLHNLLKDSAPNSVGQQLAINLEKFRIGIMPATVLYSKSGIDKAQNFKQKLTQSNTAIQTLASNYQSDMQNLQDQSLNSVNQKLSSINSNQQAATSLVNSAQSAAQQSATNFATAQTNLLANQNTQLTNLQKQQTSYKNQLPSLQAQLKSLQAQQNSLQAKQTTLQEHQQTLQTACNNAKVNLPGGNYSQSCSGCTYNLCGQTLTCTSCTDNGGNGHYTSITVPANATNVANQNGNLYNEGTVPGGSYMQSCTGCSYNGTTLSCNCTCGTCCGSCSTGLLVDSGTTMNTSINVPASASNVNNCNGYLTNGGC